MEKEINILYTFEDNSFEIIQLFTQLGPVPSKVVSTIYSEFKRPGSPDGLIFSSLEEIGRFVLELLTEAGSPEGFILSIEDYNIGVDSCLDTEQFREMFRRFGTNIQNTDSGNRKKNLFTKFFN
jgi:hypothetical protein